MISIDEIEFHTDNHLRFFNIFAKSETGDYSEYSVRIDLNKESMYSADSAKISLSECIMYSNRSVSLEVLKIESV